MWEGWWERAIELKETEKKSREDGTYHWAAIPPSLSILNDENETIRWDRDMEHFRHPSQKK